MQTAESGVELAMDLGHLHAERAQRLGQIRLAGTVQRVDGDAQPRGGDSLTVHERAERLKVRPHDVGGLERAARLRWSI